MFTPHDHGTVRVPVTVLPVDQTRAWWSVVFEEGGWRPFRKQPSQPTCNGASQWLLKHQERVVVFEQLDHVPLPQVLTLPHEIAHQLLELFIKARLLTVQPDQRAFH